MIQKFYYMTLGYLLVITNLLLLSMRLNALGGVFGIFAFLSFIKALSIRK